MASTSSMKMMAGAFSLASLNTSRTILGPCSTAAVHQRPYDMWLPRHHGQLGLVNVLRAASKHASCTILGTRNSLDARQVPTDSSLPATFQRSH